jgi:hypothetical protein
MTAACNGRAFGAIPGSRKTYMADARPSLDLDRDKVSDLRQFDSRWQDMGQRWTSGCPTANRTCTPGFA